MKDRTLQRKLRNFSETGSPGDRINFLELDTPLLDQDIRRLTEIKDARKLHHQRTLETWYGTLSSPIRRPTAIPEHTRTAQKYFWSGIAGITAEGLLTAYIFGRMGMSAWWAIIVAVLIGLFVETIISFSLKNVDRPRETLRRIKHWIMVPSATVFFFSFILLLLARTIKGDLAVLLLPAFNVSLWTITIGLLGVVGACLAASEVWAWSKRDERGYDKLEKEETKTMAVRDKFNRELSALRSAMKTSVTTTAQRFSSATIAGAPVGGSGRTNGRRFPLKNAIPVVLLALVPFLHACTSEPSKASTQQPAATRTSLVQIGESDFDIYVDASLSVEDSALEGYVRDLIAQLPAVVERWKVLKVSVYTFGEDGWNCSLTYSRELPGLPLSTSPKVDKGEVGALLPNIAESIDENEMNQREQKDRQVRRQYLDELKIALSGLTEKAFLPIPRSAEPRCTDLNGLFHRVATSSTSRPRLVLLLTDGEERCKRNLLRVAAPANLTAMLIALLPEKLEEQKVRKLSFEHFEERKAQIAAAIPWARIVPFFDHDYDAAFSEALTRMLDRSEGRLATTSAPK